MQEDQRGSENGPGGTQPPENVGPQVSTPGGGTTPWKSANDTTAFGNAGRGDTVSFGRPDEPAADAAGEQQAGGAGTLPASSYGPGGYGPGAGDGGPGSPSGPEVPGSGTPGTPGAPGGYGAAPGYGQGSGYGQPGSGYGQGGAYGQPGGYGQAGTYGQPGNSGTYGQPGNPGQPGEYGPAGNYSAAGDYGPAGGYGPPGGGYGPGGYGSPGGGYGGWGSPADGYGEPPPRKRRGIAVLVVVAVLAAAAGAGTAVALNSSGKGGPTGVSSNDVPAPQSNGSNSNGNTGSGLNSPAVAAKVEPGVVDITSTLNYQSETAEGTGMVLNSNGLVLTNNHVINGATTIKATQVSTSKTYTARVVGYDITDDVALLQLQNASGLKTVSVGNSTRVSLGTPVLAIGNAGGQGGTPTIAPGIINAVNRTITAGDQGSQTTETLHGMLQTSAQIQPGDSGGPLANASGKVIGMDTAASSSSTQSSSSSTMGYAIPINTALSIARQIAAGHAGATIQIGLPGFLGVLVPQSNSSNPQQQGQQQGQGSGFGGLGGNGTGRGGGQGCVSSATANSVPSTIAPASSGALIDNVLCGSAAARSGLGAGDVITAVNGQAVTTPGSLTTIMSKFHGGDKVTVNYETTSGAKQIASLTLGTSPAK
jgi:S1-C subfamily serine protease